MDCIRRIHRGDDRGPLEIVDFDKGDQNKKSVFAAREHA